MKQNPRDALHFQKHSAICACGRVQTSDPRSEVQRATSSLERFDAAPDKCLECVAGIDRHGWRPKTKRRGATFKVGPNRSNPEPLRINPEHRQLDEEAHRAARDLRNEAEASDLFSREEARAFSDQGLVSRAKTRELIASVKRRLGRAPAARAMFEREINALESYIDEEQEAWKREQGRQEAARKLGNVKAKRTAAPRRRSARK